MQTSFVQGAGETLPEMGMADDGSPEPQTRQHDHAAQPGPGTSISLHACKPDVSPTDAIKCNAKTAMQHTNHVNMHSMPHSVLDTNGKGAVEGPDAGEQRKPILTGHSPAAPRERGPEPVAGPINPGLAAKIMAHLTVGLNAPPAEARQRSGHTGRIPSLRRESTQPNSQRPRPAADKRGSRSGAQGNMDPSRHVPIPLPPSSNVSSADGSSIMLADRAAGASPGRQRLAEVIAQQVLQSHHLNKLRGQVLAAGTSLDWMM